MSVEHWVVFDLDPVEGVIEVLTGVPDAALAPIIETAKTPEGELAAVVAGDYTPGQALDAALGALDAALTGSGEELVVEVHRVSIQALAGDERPPVAE